MIEPDDDLKVANFLLQTKDDLDWIVRHMDVLAPSLESVREPGKPSIAQESLKAAWDEFNGPNGDQTSLDIFIRELQSKNSRHNRSLDEHGLTGAQLSFKLLIVSSHKAMLEDAKKRIEEAMDRRRHSGWRNLWVRIGRSAKAEDRYAFSGGSSDDNDR